MGDVGLFRRRNRPVGHPSRGLDSGHCRRDALQGASTSHFLILVGVDPARRVFGDAERDCPKPFHVDGLRDSPHVRSPPPIIGTAPGSLFPFPRPGNVV